MKTLLTESNLLASLTASQLADIRKQAPAGEDPVADNMLSAAALVDGYCQGREVPADVDEFPLRVIERRRGARVMRGDRRLDGCGVRAVHPRLRRDERGASTGGQHDGTTLRHSLEVGDIQDTFAGELLVDAALSASRGDPLVVVTDQS